MEELIKALQIFHKYTNAKNPTLCAHDLLIILDVHKNDVSDEDHKQLLALDFLWEEDEEHYYSNRFGSA